MENSKGKFSFMKRSKKAYRLWNMSFQKFDGAVNGNRKLFLKF